ncbi:DUF4166 domain-containing protein [Vitiosangium sp. GDMCC 1.1324]|uniref:DUF4166 domain-containing protein n=1 Tax=Vitiosangium sp. (strain GDMCC 1.1324) TaxID=2138576 RepID=UPI000D3D3719|nr:DUF4166 domain-containing protein [Vitiosangium sp. GDMCC 1.1324]PTL83987.1 DUF4166 domain-containing protein [Vitiosangium sp. GDMCC 1.1324]
MAANHTTLEREREPSLYAGLLGPAWMGLPPLVRRLHREGHASGRFTIRRGPGVLSALIGWLCRFPPDGQDVPTRLVVRREGAGQCWERTFGTHALATAQRAREDGRLVEQLGPVECVFQLYAEDQGLIYEQVGAWLRLGPWSVPLPRLFTPRIEAEAVEVTGGMRVRVHIGAALVGGLLTYEGVVTPVEEAP